MCAQHSKNSCAHHTTSRPTCPAACHGSCLGRRVLLPSKPMRMQAQTGAKVSAWQPEPPSQLPIHIQRHARTCQCTSRRQEGYSLAKAACGATAGLLNSPADQHTLIQIMIIKRPATCAQPYSQLPCTSPSTHASALRFVSTHQIAKTATGVSMHLNQRKISACKLCRKCDHTTHCAQTCLLVRHAHSWHLHAQPSSTQSACRQPKTPSRAHAQHPDCSYMCEYMCNAYFSRQTGPSTWAWQGSPVALHAAGRTY